MFYWTSIAMVRILGFYVLGIFIGGYAAGPFKPLLLWSAMACVALLFFLTRKIKPRSIGGFLGLTFITLTGWVNTCLFDESAQNNHLVKLNAPVYGTISTVTEPPVKTTTGYRVLISITKVRTPRGWINAHSDAYWYFKTEVRLNRGDILVTKGQPQKIKKSPPGSAFDYTLYLKRKNIFFRQYLSSDQFLIAGKTKTDLYSCAINIRHWCIRQISKFITGKNERAIAIALITGQSDDLDPELNQYYAVNGTLHVLSVSGLHTGLLYGIILFLLKPLGKVKHGVWIISLITMMVLWCYSLITGLSPSVLRAVTMFSFIAVSKPLGLRSGIWNTLASSAFILLLFNPWLITGIGFQLSYLALGGIIWLHPVLLRQWEPNSWIMFSAWNLTCMSVAAQLTTLPVSLFNFNQFPVWFIPANLLVIPVSSAALMAGLAFIPLSTLPYIAEASGLILELLIRLMNQITIFIAELPGASITHIYLLPSETILLMCLIISTGIYLEKQKQFFLIVSVTTAAVFGMLDYQWKVKEIHSGQMLLDVRRTKSYTQIKSGGHNLWVEMNSASQPVKISQTARHPWLLSERFIKMNKGCIVISLKNQPDVTIINSRNPCDAGLKNTLLILGPHGRLPEISSEMPEMIIIMNPQPLNKGLNKRLPSEKVSILQPDTVIMLDMPQKEIPVD